MSDGRPQRDSGEHAAGGLSGARFWVLIAMIGVLVIAVGSLAAVLLLGRTSPTLAGSSSSASPAASPTASSPASAPSTARPEAGSAANSSNQGSSGSSSKTGSRSTPTPTAKSDVPPTIDSFTVDPNVVTCDTHSPSSVGAVADPALGFSWSTSNLTSDYQLRFQIGSLGTFPENGPDDLARVASPALVVPAHGSRIETFLCADGNKDMWHTVQYDLEIYQGINRIADKDVVITDAGDQQPWTFYYPGQ